MSNNFRYPKILCPGELKAFNDRMTQLLGTPIFFTAPVKLFRPKATDAIGAMYEAVSGLYVVYHDYGMKMLRTYRDFCRYRVLGVGFSQNDGFAHSDPHKPSHHETVAQHVWNHCRNIDDLRGGLFHGCLPNAFQSDKLRNVMDRIIYNAYWPDDLAVLTEQQAQIVMNRLADNSDKMFEYFERCAIAIADPMNGGALLNDWRNELIEKVFNADDPQYEGEPYFDGRIINDMENSVKPGKGQIPHQEAIREWLRSLKEPIQNGTLTSAQLYATLKTTFLDLYDPSVHTTAASTSSVGGGMSSMASLLGADQTAKLAQWLQS